MRLFCTPFFLEKTNEFCSSTEVKKDDNVNKNKPTTEWFFSPRKRVS